MDFELQPALLGTLVKLRPLLQEDFSALYEVASDPLLWEQHPHKERYQKQVFEQFFEDAIKSKGAFATLKVASNQVIGSSRFYNLDISKKQISVGYSFLSRSCWGHTYNKEMKKLMLDHAFNYGLVPARDAALFFFSPMLFHCFLNP